MPNTETLLTDEGIRHEGIWWLPENPSLRVPGTVAFSPSEGTTVSLQGVLGGTHPFGPENMLALGLEEMQTIFGRTSAGQDVTLFDCFETRRNLTSRGSGTSEVFANRMCVGIHLRRIEEPCFSAVEFRLSHMDSWVNKHGFNFILPTSWRDKSVVEYVVPLPVKASYQQGQSLSIEFGFRGPSLSLPQTESSIQQTCCFRAERTGGMSLQDSLNTVRRFLDLISLAAASPAVPLAIRGIPGGIEGADPGRARVEVTIYVPFHVPSGPPKVVHPPHLVFTLQDVQDRFPDLVARWISSRASLPEVHGLYFATLSERSPLLEHHFLNLAHALEAYHRGRYGGTELPEGEHAKRLESILRGAPPENKTWLQEKLRYSNELSLRERLKRLVAQEPFSEICGGNSKEFIHRVVDTRNYLVHFDPSLRSSAADGRELYRLREKLMLLVTGALLHELGFPPAGVKDQLSRNPRYRQALDAQ